MRLGPIFTAFLAGTLSLSFFVHERPLPPTVGLALAGIAIAVPTVFLIWVMTRPGESRDAAFGLLFLQVIATGAAMAALANQKTNLPPMAILLPLALFVVPLVATTVAGPRSVPAEAGAGDLPAGGLENGMSALEAIRYATTAARESQLAGGHDQSIAS